MPSAGDRKEIPGGMLLSGANKTLLQAALPAYIRGRRWFGGKARQISLVDIVDLMPLGSDGSYALILIVQVNYSDGESQKYVLPTHFASDADMSHSRGEAIAQLTLDDGTANPEQVALYDATFDPGFTSGLLDAVRNEKKFESEASQIIAWRTGAFDALQGSVDATLQPSVMSAEQSNTSIRYGDRFILKLFRRLEEGTSPELEVGRFLGEHGFANTPPLTGAIEYKRGGGEPLTLAVLQGFVSNMGDAWSYTLRAISGYYKRTMERNDMGNHPIPSVTILDMASVEIPEEVNRLLGDYLQSARLLGKRTAEMHLALGSDRAAPAFAPEAFTREYQDSLYGAMQELTQQAFGMLLSKVDGLNGAARADADALVTKESLIADRFLPLREQMVQAMRTRCHGDYHLGQVLYTGSDFMIIDFEGEPVRSLAERRQKHSPLKDVAGMLRSFHYASYSGMFEYTAEHGDGDSAALRDLEQSVGLWQKWVSAAYLGEYLAAMDNSGLLPLSKDDLQMVLDAHLLEKAVYELVYELNNRPDWIRIPIQGILQLAG